MRFLPGNWLPRNWLPGNWRTILSYVFIFGLLAAVNFLPPDTSLGVLVNVARPAVETRPWLFYWPGIMIILIALTINFVGDGLRDAFDPRQTRQRR